MIQCGEGNLRDDAIDILNLQPKLCQISQDLLANCRHLPGGISLSADPMKTYTENILEKFES